MPPEKPDMSWTPTPPATPELDKQREIIESGKSQILGDFYDWMTLVMGWSICKFSDQADQYLPIMHRPQSLLEMYFDIDPNEIEKERRLLLDHIRSQEPALENESDENIAAMGSPMEEDDPNI